MAKETDVVKILVHTDEETLDKKKRAGRFQDGMYCYWRVSRIPCVSKHQSLRIYFATSGIVRGYFDVFQIIGDDLCFFSESWTPLPPDELVLKRIRKGWSYLSI